MVRIRGLGRTTALTMVVISAILLGAGLLGRTPVARQRAHAQTAGWQYHIGVNPDFGGRPVSRTIARLQYTTSGNTLNPADTGNWYAFWTAASDEWYSPNWYQVGYGIFQPNNPYGVPRRWIFIQSTAASGYFWCNGAYGLSLSNGALGQADAGCSGDADVFGLVLGNSYNFEIVVTNDPASGPDGPIYGCNGNTRFLVGGIEVGHLADCSSGGGMNGISASVLEPTSAYGVTAKSATNLYRMSELQSSFQAVIGGVTTRPALLSKYCGYDPPAGAGSIIYSNVRARPQTYRASCAGTASSVAAAAIAQDTAAAAAISPAPLPTVPASAPTPAAGKPGSGKLPSAPQQAASTGGTGGPDRRVYDPARGSLPALKPVQGRAPARAVQSAATADQPAPLTLPKPRPAEPD